MNRYIKLTGIENEPIYIMAKNVVYFYGTSNGANASIAVMTGEKPAIIRVKQTPKQVMDAIESTTQQPGMFTYSTYEETEENTNDADETID